MRVTPVANQKQVPECDILLFVTTKSEEEALLHACSEFSLDCREYQDPRLGRYLALGRVGARRVVAIKTRIGTIDHGAATSQAVLFQQRTGATSLIAMGMAFGLPHPKHRIADVIVSEAIFPYDFREVIDAGTGPISDWSKTKIRRASPELVRLIREHCRRQAPPYTVHFGLLLSGGARISSPTFRDRLAGEIPHGNYPVLGGDMEGVGLLAVSPASSPPWLVVKGISDFADGKSSDTDPELRRLACRNAVNLVLSALLDEA